MHTTVHAPLYLSLSISFLISNQEIAKKKAEHRELSKKSSGKSLEENRDEMREEMEFIKNNFTDFEAKMKRGDHMKQLTKRFLEAIEGRFDVSDTVD